MTEEIKRKRGRPKGSKGKKEKVLDEKVASEIDEPAEEPKEEVEIEDPEALDIY